VLDGGPDPPMRIGNFEGRKGHPFVKYRNTLCGELCKTAEPTQTPFGLWARMGQRNRVIDEGPAVLRDVSMASNFGTQFARTGFV